VKLSYAILCAPLAFCAGAAYGGFLPAGATGEIVVKLEDEPSTGHWRLHPHLVAYFGPDKIALDEVWGRSRKVRVFVAKDGEVERIVVLEWK